jgi:hypothetical protein
MAVIVANSSLMATSFYGQPAHMTAVVDAINYAFTCVYVVEFALKVVGLGWRNYWKNPWNKFDLLLLITGLTDMFVTLFMGEACMCAGHHASSTRSSARQVGARCCQCGMQAPNACALLVVLLCRCGHRQLPQGAEDHAPAAVGARGQAHARHEGALCCRVDCGARGTHRLTPQTRPCTCRVQGLRSLFGTLIVSLPAFWNVGALLGLMFFMYAYVGMLLLGKVKRNG